MSDDPLKQLSEAADAKAGGQKPVVATAVSARSPVRAKTARPVTSPGPHAGVLLVALAGLLMVVSFVLPWWTNSVRSNPFGVFAEMANMSEAEQARIEAKMKKAEGLMETKQGWFEAHQATLEAKAEALNASGVMGKTSSEYVNIHLRGWDIYQWGFPI